MTHPDIMFHNEFNIFNFLYKKINIELVRLQYFQFKDYDIIRNLEEYEKNFNNKDVATLKSIYIKKNKLRKLMINILNIFPYFLVGNKIDKLNKLINRQDL